MVRCQALTYKGRLLCIVHRRVHGKMADPMEIVFDDGLVKTEFNEILLDYLERQGRLSSDEDASDEDESSSGNDSDIGRAISAEIVGKRGSNRRATRYSHRLIQGPVYPSFGLVKCTAGRVYPSNSASWTGNNPSKVH